MLPGITGIMAGLSPQPPFDIEFGATAGSAVFQSTFNFAGMSWIKPEDASRKIWVGVQWGDQGDPVEETLSSASIGGVGATIHVQANVNDGSSQSLGAGIISAVVPTGASGTVSVTFSGAVSACSIGTAASVSDGGVTDTAVVETASSGSPMALSNFIDVVANGATLSAFSSSDAGNTVAWTNATETYDHTSGSQRSSGSLEKGLGVQINREISITQTLSTPPEGGVLVSVAIAPAV